LSLEVNVINEKGIVLKIGPLEVSNFFQIMHFLKS